MSDFEINFILEYFFFLKTVLFPIVIYLYSYKCLHLFFKCENYFIYLRYDSYVIPPANFRKPRLSQ